MSSCSDFETEESGSGSEEADVTREWVRSEQWDGGCDHAEG